MFTSKNREMSREDHYAFVNALRGFLDLDPLYGTEGQPANRKANRQANADARTQRLARKEQSEAAPQTMHDSQAPHTHRSASPASDSWPLDATG